MCLCTVKLDRLFCSLKQCDFQSLIDLEYCEISKENGIVNNVLVCLQEKKRLFMQTMPTLKISHVVLLSSISHPAS